MVKNPPANVGAAGEAGSASGLGRCPGGRRGNPLQYSRLENPHGQRSLAGSGPQGLKESDTIEATERVCTSKPDTGYT